MKYPLQLKAEYRKRWVREYNQRYPYLKKPITEDMIDKNESLRIMFSEDFDRMLQDAIEAGND